MIGREVSHYRVLARIGQGGMGEVYLADDLTLHRRVALKFVSEEGLGRIDAARQHYEALIKFWNAADSDLVLLREAQAEMKKLAVSDPTAAPRPSVPSPR